MSTALMLLLMELTQSRVAQAVSVERRTEQLLMKGRDEVIGWLQQLKGREQQLSQEIGLLQRELNMVAVSGSADGHNITPPNT
jgi:senataxin